MSRITDYPQPACVLAFDPGARGGWAIVSDMGLLAHGEFTPRPSRLGYPQLCPNEIRMACDAFREFAGLDYYTKVVIERVGAMPKQGVTSTFQFGMNTGALHAAIEIYLAERPLLVMPVVWKRYFGLLKQPKEAAMTSCRERYGHDLASGPADAALLAQYVVDKRP